jgi:hypothetical protein
MTDDERTREGESTNVSRRGVLQGIAVAAGTLGAGGLSGGVVRGQTDGDTRSFRVRVENVSTPDTLSTPDGSVAVPLSPGAFVTHDRPGVVFESGEPASPGLETVAEDGVPTTLAEELDGTDGVTDSGAFATEATVTDPNQPENGPEPPIFPGGAYEFVVSAAEGDALSLATMFIQSNDLFLAPAPDGVDLFENGEPVTGDVTDRFALWDAGTEIDQQPGTGADQAPRQSGLDTGAADDNSDVVSPVEAVNPEGYDYPAVEDVVRVTVERDPAARIGMYDTNGEPGIQSDEVLDAISEFNSREDTTPAPDDTTVDDVLDLIGAFGRS